MKHATGQRKAKLKHNKACLDTPLDISATESEEVTSGSEYKPTDVSRSSSSLSDDLSSLSGDMTMKNKRQTDPSHSNFATSKKRRRDESRCQSTDDESHEKTKKKESSPPQPKIYNSDYSLESIDSIDMPRKKRKFDKKRKSKIAQNADNNVNLTDEDLSSSSRSKEKTKLNGKTSTPILKIDSSKSLNDNRDDTSHKKTKKRKSTSQSIVNDSNSSLDSIDSIDMPKKKEKIAEKKTSNKSKNADDDANLTGGDNSLNLSINLNSVGPVIKNKKNEVLKNSKEGTKKSVCYYCFKERKETKNPNKKVYFSKIADHYEKAHAQEDLVIKLNAIPKTKAKKGKKKSANELERLKILEILRLKATYLNNLEVEDVSNYIVARRPQENRRNTVADYGYCFKCKKTLSYSSLNKHVRKCTGVSFKDKHAIKANSRATVGEYHEIASEDSIKIISKIRESDVLDEIRYDKTVFWWLNAEATKAERVRHHHNRIRVNLRRMGKLLKEMKILNENIDEFKDIFNEDFYDDFIEAVRIMGKMDPITRELKAPSTANDMFNLIKSVASIYDVMLGSKQEEERKKVTAFTKKVIRLWHSSIGNTIAETQAMYKRNKLVELPSEDDLDILKNFLLKEMKTAYNLLRTEYTDDNYTRLRNSLLSHLHVSNCRRAGEVEMLSETDYKSLQVDGNKYRIQVRGKRSKPVPIVFDQQVYKYLECLRKHRSQAKIDKNNPYIFSDLHDINADYTFVSGCTLMNNFSNICGAKNPESLRGTLFRKQVATKGMEQGINEQEVEKLAGYMGHTPRIHVQNYRQSVLQRDFAVAEMMQKAQSSKTAPPRFELEEEDNESSPKESEQLRSETETQDENEKENDGHAQNSNYSVGRRQRLTWTKAQIEAVLEAFPDALNINVKAPSVVQINKFLKTSTNAELRRRTEPQIRQWIHNERKKNAGKSDSVPPRNVVPTYIYSRFEKYISSGKVPSNQTCGQFLAKSPSKSNITISNIQNWVRMAIKRKST